MKARPILFSTPMVQAILEGKKTQTRRIVKPHPKQELDFFGWELHPKKLRVAFGTGNKVDSFHNFPFGQVGDVLWVKETSCFVQLEHAHILLEGAKDKNQMMYKASVHEDWMKFAKEQFNYKWTPSIFMPKNACRIWLEITDIRIERLNDISDENAKKEGIILSEHSTENIDLWHRYDDGSYTFLPQTSFRTLWESINGKGSWNENPYVWVIEFERIQKPTENV